MSGNCQDPRESFYENKMFQIREKIPLALNIDKKEFSLSVPWKPQMCGGADLKISNVSYYDIFGLNVIRKELHQMQQITVYPEKYLSGQSHQTSRKDARMKASRL